MMTSPETKVGLFTLSAIVAMLSLFMWLNGVHLFQKGDELEAVFDRVDGVRPGAPVKYIGVDIGRITRIYFEDQKVVVVFHIQPDLQLPEKMEATIASAGVVGDKYLELKPSTVEGASLTDGRIPGRNPVGMEEFYASAADVLNSIQKITRSLSELISDQEINQSLKDTILRVNRLSVSIERIAANSEPRIYELLKNINLASAQLAEAGLTTNRLLNQLDNNGQTAADIRETINQIKKVSQNLNRFSQILVEDESNIGVLMNDAHQTMQSINQAAQTIDKAVKSFSSEDGDYSQLKQNLDQAEAAVQKVNAYVKKLEKISFSQNLGTGYQHGRNLEIDYWAHIDLTDKNSLEFYFEDIGDQNLATFQFGSLLSNPNCLARAGLYKNEFGVGFDYQTHSKFSLGLDIWDTDSVNLGLSSRWKLTDKWSLRLETSTNLDSGANTWKAEWWHRF